MMTKYKRVQEWILEALESGKFKAGDLLPSEGELCELLSVGRNSVRTALSNLSHAGIVDTKKGVGTFCVGARKSGTMTVGFVSLYSQEYIFPRIVQGCNNTLSKNGYHLVLSESMEDTKVERDVLTKLWNLKVDGIILQPAYDGRDPMNLDLLRDIQLSGIPIMLIDNFSGNAPGGECCDVDLRFSEGSSDSAEFSGLTFQPSGDLFCFGHGKIASLKFE